MRTKVSLGIDIGGTNIAYGVIDKEGKCVMTDSKPIKLFDTPQEFIVSLHQEIEERLATLDADLIGVGVGAPDGNYFTGTIVGHPPPEVLPQPCRTASSDRLRAWDSRQRQDAWPCP